MRVFFKNAEGEHFQLTITDESERIVNAVLDQFNIPDKPITFITEDEFWLNDPMEVSITDPDDDEMVVAKLLTKRIKP